MEDCCDEQDLELEEEYQTNHTDQTIQKYVCNNCGHEFPDPFTLSQATN